MKKCPECGTVLIPTSATWLCCPNGHGKLVVRDDYNDAEAKKENREFLQKVDAALKDAK